MALINCPNCGKSVSDKAEQCPHCGRILSKTALSETHKPIQDILTDRKNRATVISVIAIVVALILIWVVVDQYQTKNTYISNYETYEYSQEVKTGTEGAVNTAKEYLRLSGISYSGMIKQLELEGFSTYEATYGANNCGADWNEQAVLSAKSYLRMSSTTWTKASLKKQLELEGFTSSQATYGVDHCGGF